MNHQEPNSKFQGNDRITKIRTFDLEERTQRFAVACRNFVLRLPRNIPNEEYSRQLIRASGSPAANYIEANEALGTKDFVHKMKICRKEAKEARLWLDLCIVGDNPELTRTRSALIQEATELIKIFNAIIRKCSDR
ncbi:MAG: four helix bundle protein [bacterium]|nr:four helix bundle protein [bacterium]